MKCLICKKTIKKKTPYRIIFPWKPNETVGKEDIAGYTHESCYKESVLN